MKLLLSTDFEGTSGIVAWEQIIEGNPEYEQGRCLLTNELLREGAARAVRRIELMKPPEFERPVS